MSKTWTLRWLLPLSILILVVLLPFFLAGPQIEGYIERSLTGSAPSPWIAVAIVGCLLLDVLLPVPSSLVLVASGAFFGLAVGTLVGCVGLTASCMLGYWIGANCGHWLLRPFVSEAEESQAAELLQTRGSMVLASTRAVPVLAETTTVMAGALRMPFIPFLRITSMANLGVAAVYAACGAYAVSEGSFILAFSASIVLPALGFLFERLYFKPK